MVSLQFECWGGAIPSVLGGQGFAWGCQGATGWGVGQGAFEVWAVLRGP